MTGSCVTKTINDAGPVTNPPAVPVKPPDKTDIVPQEPAVADYEDKSSALPEQQIDIATVPAELPTTDTSDQASLSETTTNKDSQPVMLRGKRAVDEQNLFYDKSNESYSLLQKANESLAGFPVNRIDEVDWVIALENGLINPRASLYADGAMQTRTDVIIMNNTKQMAPVAFSHRIHTQWLDCSNCHDQIFQQKKAAHDINMDKIFRGQYCGVCHNKVAFTTYICEKCHSVSK